LAVLLLFFRNNADKIATYVNGESRGIPQQSKTATPFPTSATTQKGLQ